MDIKNELEKTIQSLALFFENNSIEQNDGYDEYLKEIGINKNIPVKIRFNETARGFYCPICNTGTYNKKHKCNYCGQLLLGC